MTIIQTIFDIMNQKNISQAKLSRDTGIPVATISAWKQRNSCPPSDKIVAIADSLDVPVYELLGVPSVNIANNSSHCSVSISQNSDSSIEINNSIVANAYRGLTEKEKLSVQMFILETAEKSEKSNATTKIIE